MFHGNIDQFGKSLPGIQLCLRSDLRKQTRKRKDKKSIQRCQIDRLAKGYKRAIDKIRGSIATRPRNPWHVGPLKVGLLYMKTNKIHQMNHE